MRSRQLYYKALLDAIPMPIFVVDNDVRIEALNSAAIQAFNINEPAAYHLRGGDVLHCVHALDVPEGCGRGPNCKSCTIRDAIGETFRGNAVTRKRMTAEVLAPGGPKRVDLLVTASPVPGQDGLALLILEDISELVTLHELLPICAKCKRIRDDQSYWQKVESYFHEHVGVKFTHSLCPKCIEELYAGLE